MPTRRHLIAGLAAAAALAAGRARAQSTTAFEKWIAAFRPKALARGVSAATYDRVMTGLKPDTGVFALQRAQPEFSEELWQYLNRRVSDWRVQTGRDRVRELKPLLDRLENDYGVDRHILVALWGIESGFGDVVANPTYMRPVVPSLATLAWGEPRRRAYWEKELINALRIIERGWSNPKDMIGSWAGAMGHTQWMPEVWLNIGVDYDRDGRISPFGPPHDALAGSCRYLIERGRYRRGEAWGCEVRVGAARPGNAQRTYAKWQDLGVVRADGRPFDRPADQARLWRPVNGGPAFLLGQNFYAVRTYNPSMNYTLAIVHLADRIAGAGPFVHKFPGSERALTLAEIQEAQRRLTALGFDTGGTDGRVGSGTMRAVAAFQRRVGIEPADGYAGLEVLARLRQGL
jgi:lytic murein transglycosylase